MTDNFDKSVAQNNSANFYSWTEQDLLGDLSNRYYRREAIEHFLHRCHDRVALSIKPCLAAKALVLIFAIALLALFGMCRIPVDLSVRGTLSSVRGQPALTVPVDLPVKVGTKVEVSGIAADIRVVAIETTPPIIPQQKPTIYDSNERTDQKILLLNSFTMPRTPLLVTIQLKSIPLVTLALAERR